MRDNFLDGDVDRERSIVVLAESLMATGGKHRRVRRVNVEIYTPASPENPACRDAPSEPIAGDRIDDLPLRGKRPKKGQAGERTFDKSAFLYDADAGVFYCPMGKQLTRKSQRKTTQTLFTSCTALTKATVRRTRCERSGSKNSRNQSRRRTNVLCTKQRSRLTHDECRGAKYARRAALTERPFAIIKRHFGVREFLIRGLEITAC